MSFDQVTGPAFGLLMLLSTMPGSWDAAAEEHIFSDVGHPLLSGLVRTNLVLFDSLSKRYSLHDFVRSHAFSRLPEQAKDSSISEVHASYYCSFLDELAQSFLRGDIPRSAIYSKYTDEEDNFNTAQRWAASHFAKYESAAPATILFARMADSLLLDIPLSLRQYVRWVEDALAAARFMKDRRTEGRMLSQLAFQDYWLPPGKGLAYFEEGLKIAKTEKDWEFEAKLHRGRALVEQLKRPDMAMRHVSRALEIYAKKSAVEASALKNWVAASPILANRAIPDGSGFN
jgi:hypothetical protein